jgi:hypothetical protein
MEQMARNGDTDLMEERAMEKSLRCMSKRYTQIINSIEPLLDFEQLNVEDVTGMLTVQDHEHALDSEHGAARGKMLHMMEQWHTFDKEEGFSSFSSKEHRRCPCGGKKKEEKGP